MTGKVRPTREQLTQALSALATVLVRMHAAQGKILVLCQLGRNRSFTTAFCYYLCFQPQAVGRTLPLVRRAAMCHCQNDTSGRSLATLARN